MSANRRKSSGLANRVPGPLPVRRWTRRIITAWAAAILALGVAAASAAPALASGWSIQPAPDLSGPAQGGLSGVSCPGTKCLAVGDYVDTSGTQMPLADLWNGSTWSAQELPSVTGGNLEGISCTSASACTAVGEYVDSSGAQVTLAERWNGTAWSIQLTPSIAAASSAILYDVSCTSATACVSVGDYLNNSGVGQLLVEAWNGTAWSIQTITTPASGGDLARISCSAPTACTALGQSSGATLVERWNGAAWTSQSMAIPAGATGGELYGVTCTAAELCTAVGHWSEVHVQCISTQPHCTCLRDPCRITNVQSTLAEQWNGSAWTVESTPGTGVLDGVSCPTATDCTAVGFEGAATVAEQWNGSSWAAQTIPSPASGGGLQEVACTAAANCVAVGNGSGVTLAEGWNGTSWAIQPTTNPPGPANRGLSGVSCATAAACTAVGSYTSTSGTQLTLAEHWNGTSWAAQSTPNQTGAIADSLSGVSCATTTACIAAGAYSTGGGNPPLDFASAEGWDGTSWATEPTPSLGVGYDTVLSGVSCTTATACIAVGYDYYNQGPQDAVLAEQWNGSGWANAGAAIPPTAYSSSLSGVSCPSAEDCIAVGGSGVDVPPLAEQWNGTAWTILTTAGVGDLSGVSCPAANACIAVGNSGGTMLAEQWNGTTWTTETPQTPANSNGAYLSAVSCTTANDCTVVGYYTLVVGPDVVPDVTLAEHWDGTTWTIQPTPNPPGAVGSYLSGVSCTTATTCTAVGHYQNQSNMDVTLAEGYTG